jgi:hypothetical protein
MSGSVEAGTVLTAALRAPGGDTILPADSTCRAGQAGLTHQCKVRVYGLRCHIVLVQVQVQVSKAAGGYAGGRGGAYNHVPQR